jgi:hypothetical protein
VVTNSRSNGWPPNAASFVARAAAAALYCAGTALNAYAVVGKSLNATAFMSVATMPASPLAVSDCNTPERGRHRLRQHHEAMPRKTERACDCGAAIRCADVAGPVVYDEMTNEFHLIVGERRHRLVYCFNCGGKLPESTRGRRFTTPSAVECGQVAVIVHSCRSAADVVHELGSGDVISVWDMRSHWPPGDRPWRRQFVYTRRWKTLVLVVVEYADGSLSFGINGQPLD